jgi:hypothetical protein
MDEQKQIPIWFFVGGLLLTYGVIIFAEGVHHLFVPQANAGLALQWVHADLWWGIVLIALGGFYVWHYFPTRAKR